MSTCAPADHPLFAELRSNVRGDVRFDRLSRTLYATDASIYEIVPAGVVLPASVDDVIATVNACRAHDASIVPRGGGTGLTGGAIGPGVAVDFSRHMTRIANLDLDNGTVDVQPGVVLDELNAFLSPHGLQFAPDVSPSSRATIGGMIANNACGAHSIRYKRTVDHVQALTVVLSDGSVTTWPNDASAAGNARALHIDGELRRIAITYRDEVQKRFPALLRHNGGYALDSICNNGEINPATIVCGSEGTLCAVVDARLRLTPLPAHKALAVVHFNDLLDALAATPRALEHAPAAVELIDDAVLSAAKRDPTTAPCWALVDREAPALLIVELFADARDELNDRMQALASAMTGGDTGARVATAFEPAQQNAVWGMRKRGLGMLMSRPGDEKSYAFVEDSAVDPHRLRDYISEFRDILTDEGIRKTAFYAHASVGVIHVRPALNLKTAEGVVRMGRIAERVAELTLRYQGAVTGEHGDGLLRSCWHARVYGPSLVQAFREVKQAFDPDNVFNPNKIVDAPAMTEHLRFGAEYTTRPVKTLLNFDAYAGEPRTGLAGMAEMCSGVGQCRQRLVGTMCPSYMATHDETHTTRARANALRVALSNRGLLEGLDDPALDDVMDLCLSCKACKSECPTGVDMARMKAEWMAHRHMRRGVPPAARFIADAPKWARLGSRAPRLVNLVMRSRPFRALAERRYGLDRRIPPPRLANTTFRSWFKRHRRARPTADNAPRVVYFVDTWTNYYTPAVGIAAVRLLEAAGYRVVVPQLECCGRTMISKGLLVEARGLAERNIQTLARFADAGIPIVGTEPSCILTLVDEYPQLVRDLDADTIARCAVPIDVFLERLLADDPSRITFAEANPSFGQQRAMLLHGHCHQKAIVGTRAAAALLNRPPAYSATEINSGCCGMAGSFGHEAQHYEIAAAVGEQRLFPAVRDRGHADIVVSGFSCRTQIEHHTAVTPLHLTEALAAALPGAHSASTTQARSQGNEPRQSAG